MEGNPCATLSELVIDQNLTTNRHRSSVEEENTLTDIPEIALDTRFMERLADAGSRICLCDRPPRLRRG